jgi:tetratricopeptide (TPR) repeat protein
LVSLVRDEIPVLDRFFLLWDVDGMNNTSSRAAFRRLLLAVLIGSISSRVMAYVPYPSAFPPQPNGTAQPANLTGVQNAPPVMPIGGGTTETLPKSVAPSLPEAPGPSAADLAEGNTPLSPLATPDQRAVVPVTETRPTTILGKIMALLNPPAHRPLTEQEEAVQLARQHHYEESLAIFERIYPTEKTNENVVRDYTTVLSWAGQDKKAVDMYQTMRPHQPDYVLAAVGHSYRELSQLSSALDIYHLGTQEYPDSTLFAEGEIRCLADLGRPEDALAKANENLAKYGERDAIKSAQRDLTVVINKINVRNEEDTAVSMARQNKYAEALAMLNDLHNKNPENQSVLQDYLAVSGWAGGHDDQVIALYNGMPVDVQQPDYVLEAVGHAYRQRSQWDMALQIYRQGLLRYPNNVFFAEGVIRSLADQAKYDDALVVANNDIRLHGNRPIILDARKNIFRLKHGRHRRIPRVSGKTH